MQKFKVVGCLALLVAVIAPLWAALTAYFGLLTGAVALICAGLYVANGMILANALKITLGFLFGNIWGWLAFIAIPQIAGMIGNLYVAIFLVLFVFAGLAVFIACYLDKILDLSALLSGLSIILVVLLLSANPGFTQGHTIPPLTLVLHVAIAMVGGIWLVGVLITELHKKLISPKKAG